jgi:drug/metabolite transporter (DMT)-like permease
MSTILVLVLSFIFLKEKLAWNYLVAFGFLGVAAFFAFAFKAPGPAA